MYQKKHQNQEPQSLEAIEQVSWKFKFPSHFQPQPLPTSDQHQKWRHTLKCSGALVYLAVFQINTNCDSCFSDCLCAGKQTTSNSTATDATCWVFSTHTVKWAILWPKCNMKLKIHCPDPKFNLVLVYLHQHTSSTKSLLNFSLKPEWNLPS